MGRQDRATLVAIAHPPLTPPFRGRGTFFVSRHNALSQVDARSIFELMLKKMIGTRAKTVSDAGDALSSISLSSIDKVTFNKRDEITTDLICCEVLVANQIWTLHEDMPGWDAIIAHLGGLPGFREDWFAAVSQPAFQPCETVAFER